MGIIAHPMAFHDSSATLKVIFILDKELVHVAFLNLLLIFPAKFVYICLSIPDMHYTRLYNIP